MEPDKKEVSRIAVISLSVNAVLATGKIATGLFSGSAAITADGIHSVTDVFSSAVGFAGIKMSQKPMDSRHPYGYHKFEALAGFLITLLLFGTGAGIIYGAYRGFVAREKLNMPPLAYVVMLLSAVINEVMARVKFYFGKKGNSSVLMMDGFHSRVDVYTSVAVFIGIILSGLWGGFDRLLALLIGIYIIVKSFSMGKESVDSLLDISADPETEEKIRSIAEARNIAVESLSTQKKGAAVTVNIIINLPGSLKVDEAQKISDNLRNALTENIGNLTYVAIQVKSHEVKTGFYKPAFGHSFGWRGRDASGKETGETPGMGPGGYCVCPDCGYKTGHSKGSPCSGLACPKCGAVLKREYK